MLHLDDWMYTTEEDGKLQFHTKVVPKDIDIEKSIAYAANSIKEYSKGRICLLLSGGWDSQLTYHCLKKGGLDFNIIIIDHGENYEDVKAAETFCDLHDEEYYIMYTDSKKFLDDEFGDYVEKYKLTSPQWAIHCKSFERLRSMGYKTIILGGDPLTHNGHTYEYFIDTSKHADWQTWSKIRDVQVLNFLSWTPEICFYFAHYSPPSKFLKYSELGFSFVGSSGSGFKRLNRSLSKEKSIPNALDAIYRTYAKENNKYLKASSHILYNGEKINVQQY